MINRILERLEEPKNYSLMRADDDEYYEGKATAYEYAIEIVQEVAKEYETTENKDFELLLKAVKDSYPIFKGAYVELDVFLGDVMRKFTRDKQAYQKGE